MLNNQGGDHDNYNLLLYNNRKKIKRSQFHPFSYMTSHQIHNMGNMTGITSGAEHPCYAQVFSEVVQSLVYCFVDQ
jgi:hypothetical protein